MKHIRDELKNEALSYGEEKGLNHFMIHFKRNTVRGDLEYEAKVHVIENGAEIKECSYYKSEEVHKQLAPFVGDFIVEINNGQMTLYSEREHKEIESLHGDALLNRVYQSLQPHLDEEIDYHYRIKTSGSIGHISCSNKAIEYRNGEEVEKTSKIEFLNGNFACEYLLLRLYSNTFPSYSEVDVKYSKNKGITIEVATTKDLLQRLRKRMLVSLKKENAETLVSEMNLEPFLKTNRYYHIESEEYVHIGGEIQTGGYKPFYKEIALLSNALNHPFKKVKIILTEDDFKVMADVPMASLNIGALSDEAQEEISANTAFIYLESGNTDKIKRALEIVKKDVLLRDLAEKRYLPFMEAHLNRPVVLDDLLEVKEILREDKLGDFFVSRRPNVKNDYVSFGMLYDHECKTLVDFIGATVKACMDIEEVINEMKRAYDAEDMQSYKRLFMSYSETYKNYLLALRKTGPETWFTQSIQVLLDLALEKVMFDHTDFDTASESPVLREFVFALHLLSAGSLYFDVFQSSPVDLTECFWLYLETPTLSFVESEACTPKNPFERQRVL